MYTMILGYRATAAYCDKPGTAELLPELFQQIGADGDTIEIVASQRAPWIYVVTLRTNEDNFTQEVLDIVESMHRNGFDFHEIDEDTASSLKAEIAKNAKDDEERDRRYQEHAKLERNDGYYSPGIGRARGPSPLSERRTPR